MLHAGKRHKGHNLPEKKDEDLMFTIVCSLSFSAIFIHTPHSPPALIRQNGSLLKRTETHTWYFRGIFELGKTLPTLRW